MLLIYVYKGNNADKLFNIDYIRFHFKICYIIYFKQDKDRFNKFLSELLDKIGPEEINILKMNDLFLNNEISLKDSINNKPKDEFKQTILSIYYKEIAVPPHLLNVKENLIDYFKFLLEYIKTNKDPIYDIKLNDSVIIDLSNCPQPLFSILYFLILKNLIETEIKNYNVICWDESLNNPFMLPIQFLDTISQMILDLIAEENSTIKELQQIYSENRNLDKIVSQPFISKYISQLLKQNLIKEEWFEGIKHFYLSEYGYLHIRSSLQQIISQKSIEKRIQYKIYSTSDLIQKLVMSHLNKDEKMVITYLQELLVRDNLTLMNIFAIMDKLKGYHHEKLKELLEKGLKLDPSSSKLLILLANYHFEEKNYPMAFNFCKEAIKNDPNSPLAWELLGKLSLNEETK